MAGKFPPCRAGKDLDKLSRRDRTIEKVHGDHGHDAIREISVNKKTKQIIQNAEKQLGRLFLSDRNQRQREEICGITLLLGR